MSGVCWLYGDNPREFQGSRGLSWLARRATSPVSHRARSDKKVPQNLPREGQTRLLRHQSPGDCGRRDSVLSTRAVLMGRTTNRNVLVETNCSDSDTGRL